MPRNSAATHAGGTFPNILQWSRSLTTSAQLETGKASGRSYAMPYPSIEAENSGLLLSLRETIQSVERFDFTAHAFFSHTSFSRIAVL